MSGEMVIFPIPLGECIAKIEVPGDLTMEEAAKIARVVMALAVPNSLTAALPEKTKPLENNG